MPSGDEQAIEQNRRNSILDLQLTGISLKLHERPDIPFSRPGSRSEYLTRPMSAIPLYFKEKSKGIMKERPRSAGPQSLRRKALQSSSHYSSPRSRNNTNANLSSKALCSRSDLSLHTHSTNGRRGGARLEPGLASKPPLPPGRPVHTQSLDDIVNIKFLKWFPESASSDKDSKEVDEDEAVGRCDSSLGNDDISDLASSDSRLGFNSPDIALNTEGNLRPNRLRSPDRSEINIRDEILSRTNSLEDYDSPRPLMLQPERQTQLRSVQPLNCFKKNMNCENSSESPNLSHRTQNDEVSETTPVYEPLQKNKPLLIDQEKNSPIFTKRERLSSRSNSASTSGSGGSGKKFSKTSRSISVESSDSNCNSVIDNPRLHETQDSEKLKSSIDFMNGQNEKILQDNLNPTLQHNERNLKFGTTTMFDSNESIYETSSRHQMFSTPESLISPEPIHNRQKIQRTKFSYRTCRNTTPDSLTTPEPSQTPELPSTSVCTSYNVDNRKAMKKVTIELCNSTSDKRKVGEKASQDSGLSERDFNTGLDYDLLHVGTAITDSKDKISVDSGVRSMLTSVDGKATPVDNQPVSKHDEILSWMGNSLQENGEGGEVTSTYDELMNMIKTIEHDEVESIKLEVLSTGRSTNNSACSNIHSINSQSGHATRDILGLLEGVEEASRSVETHRTCNTDGQRTVNLAQRCMALSDKLESEKQKHAATYEELKQLKDQLSKIQSQSESTVSRHQTFIDQLLKEKRALGEQCAALVKEIELKHKKALKTIEERHAVELQKQEEKLLAAEKIRREKWIDLKTKKIKEMTVAGVESELNRLTTAHQDEIKELRRHHEEELNRNETIWSRRLSQAREEAAREREAAVSEEREAARNRLQAEVSRLEADQRDARRNLLQELRDERQRAELQMERTLADRSAVLDSKYQQALVKLDEKLADVNKLHEEELNRLREALESERENWLSLQTKALADKEREVKAEAKRERDRHIEAAIRKLDQESVEKQQLLENKLLRLKEGWEEERKELETEVRDLKRKLKEARREIDEVKLESETFHSRSRLEAETNASQIAELKAKLAEKNSGDSFTASRISELEQQLNKARSLHQQALSDKQAQLDLLYTRVKEAVSKKDDQIRILQKERDTALEQCRQLESIMERRTAID